MEANIDCRLMDDLSIARRQKLVWNVPFNGLAIIGGSGDVSNILNTPSLAHLARCLMTEIIGIAKQFSYEIPHTFIDQQFEATTVRSHFRHGPVQALFTTRLPRRTPRRSRGHLGRSPTPRPSDQRRVPSPRNALPPAQSPMLDLRLIALLVRFRG